MATKDWRGDVADGVGVYGWVGQKPKQYGYRVPTRRQAHFNLFGIGASVNHISARVAYEHELTVGVS